MHEAGEVNQATKPDSNSVSSSSLAAFDRCLVDGDAASISRRRSSRRKALGLSVTVEGLLLALVVLAPLLTTVAQPQIRREIYVPFMGRRAANPVARPAKPIRLSPFTNGRFAFPIGARPSP